MLSKQTCQWTTLNRKEDIIKGYGNKKRNPEYNMNITPLKQKMKMLFKNWSERADHSYLCFSIGLLKGKVNFLSLRQEGFCNLKQES